MSLNGDNTISDDIQISQNHEISLLYRSIILDERKHDSDIINTEEEIKNIKINRQLFDQINLDTGGVIVTSKGTTCDFVSRFFAPKIGINEDPVTGSAHTLLIPYWAKMLGKNNLEAIQLSKRTGYLKCSYLNDRVEMSGQAKTYLKGKLTI